MLLAVAVSEANAERSHASIAVHIVGLAPLATIALVPPKPQIDTSTPLGGSVAAYAVTMPDGSPSTGTVQFGPPYFDAGGLFAMTGTGAAGNIIVNPAGPGLSGLTVPIIESITVQAITH
jgi:hypothetical protein